MDIMSIEGFPVGFTRLSDDNLKDLQSYYLPIISNISENDLCTDYNKISKNRDQKYDTDQTFNKYNEIILPYLDYYIDSFNFNFSYNTTINTWYNVYAKHDHQQLHNHIVNNVPAFSCVCLLKQPFEDSRGGQLCFPTPNLSNHLKYLELDPSNNYPNIFQTPTYEGSIVFFPSCLDHFVTYNQTDELRAIFSSNIIVKPTN